MPIDIELCFARPAKQTATLFGRVFPTLSYQDACTACTNFDYDVASQMYLGREELWLSTPSLGPYPDAFKSVQFHTRFEEVIEQADAGCPSCVLLREAVLALSYGSLKVQSAVDLQIVYCRPYTMTIDIMERPANLDESDAPAWQMKVRSGENKMVNFQIELFTLPGEPTPWPAIGSLVTRSDPYTTAVLDYGGDAKIIPVHCRSQDSFHRMRSMLDHCRQSHPWCSRRNAPLLLPSRLLSIGNRLEDTIYLTNKISESMQYAALSHCWGRSRHALLTTVNEAQYRTQLMWDELPLTFRDTIEIARELGISYLWIDSLCILQDSADDWKREAANMGAIYANAELTIAADSGRDGDSGCLKDRKDTICFKIKEHDGSDTQVYARQALNHSAFGWNSGGQTSANQASRLTSLASEYPLLGRGWTLQERLLSRRILHFCSDEMVWECLGGTTCECGALSQHVDMTALRDRQHAAGIPFDIEWTTGRLDRARALVKHICNSAGLPGFEPGVTAITRGSMPYSAIADVTLLRLLEMHTEANDLMQSELDIHARWRELVAAYSTRALTYKTDALPALSGLARQWLTRAGKKSRYLAGLWETDLNRSLMWKCVDEERTARASTYVAPSWSWAAVARPVAWLEEYRESIYHAELLEATCITDEHDSFGHVSYGHLRLQCKLLPVTLKMQEGWRPPSHSAFVSANNKTQFVKIDSYPECVELDGCEVYATLYCTDVTVVGTTRGHRRGLVLRKVESIPGQVNVYSRIGIIEEYPLVQWDNSEQPFEEILMV